MINTLATPAAASPGNPAARRGMILLAIALIAFLLPVLFTLLLPAPTAWANDFFYDLFYRSRPATDMRNADVILVTADEPSLRAVDEAMHFGWPWPREFWGQIALYLDKAGAKAIAFDIVFEQTSQYQQLTGDDTNFADAVNALKTPAIFGATALPNGQWERFAPKVNNPTFGAINVGNDKVYRWYDPYVYAKPSLAYMTYAEIVKSPATAAGKAQPLLADAPFPDMQAPFRLHYYGPHQLPDGLQTFTYIPAATVLDLQLHGDAAQKKYNLPPDLFKNKIVILCATAVGTYDLKSSPLSAEFPGPEVQATAIENLLRHERVTEVAPAWVILASLLAALLISTGVVLPRHVGLKLLAPILATALLFAVAITLFQNNHVTWLPPLQPLLAIVLATPLAFAWTYFAEDRQRRFMLRALSKVVSPAIADELAKNPQRLARGTIRTDLTLLFTDLANFTGLSEHMDVQTLGQFMNRYLGDMSDEVFAQNGTLDKYIGDAVMAFWNAPLPQADHALRACKAALAMVAREKQLHARLSASTPAADLENDPQHKLFTRIGINTAPVAVGFIGSEHLFNYTALGDGVNLASRLEGANKLYGTRILLSAHTADLVKEHCWLRKVDVVRVKGKTEPMAVFELRAIKDNPADAAHHQRIIAGYEAAFIAYQARRWDEAEHALVAVMAETGTDAASQSLLKRVREFRLKPPDSAWDGVYDSSTK